MDSIFDATGKDEVYCAIKNEINSHYQEAKIFVEKLWEKAHEYLDSDILEELPVQFHQRFWEIYLAASLLEAGLDLQPSISRDGPDICINGGDGSKVWVEAVTTSSGQGSDAVQEADPNTVETVPDDPIKLRLLNAFSAKSEKYCVYRTKNWVSSEEPYIIAINAAQVPSATLERDIPRIVKSLLSIGFPVLHLNGKTLEVSGSSYEYQGEVVKVSGTKLETNFFLNSKYSGISAVIYSCTDVLNHPAEIGGELLLIHNPLARNPLPLGFLKKGREYWVDLHCKNWNQENPSASVLLHPGH
jgi:hypothetical protein